jgi:hypothetical protein
MAHEFGHVLTEGPDRPQASDWSIAVQDTPGAAEELSAYKWAKVELSPSDDQWPGGAQNPRNYDWRELQAHMIGDFAAHEQDFKKSYPALTKAVSSVAESLGPESRLNRWVGWTAKGK